MQLVKAKFVERIRRTATIDSFRFTPQGPVDFLPGQFLKVMFDTVVANNTVLNKYLSFSCAPQKKYFEISKRLSESEFSTHLKALELGQDVMFQMPIGNCVYRNDYERVVFLIGGIGITPAISIIEYIVGNKLDTKVSLLYANRSEDEIAFKRELDGWRFSNKNIDVCYVVSKKACQDSDCREGTINEPFCRDTVGDIAASKVFIYGPPQMVEAMKRVAITLGCDKENILSENFIGY
jgi:ferredoxin-NADP reductase